MALARVVYTQSVAGNKNFTVPFPYISRDHVKVTVNGSPASFTWLNTNTVQIDPAPAVGAVVEIRRVTERRNLLVDFKDGSTITETDLDLLALQNFYLSQEADDLAEESNGIANAAASTANNAIAIANQASSNAASAVAAANNAVTTANNAQANANNAVSTANNALSIANNASSNANAAVATANNAQTAANNAVSIANSAKDTANSAASQATTAVSTANTAAQNAATALSKANTALANSETAISTANTALTKADSAEAAAVTASQAAQSAAVSADTAVNTAQQLQTSFDSLLDSVQQIAGADLSDFAKNSDNLAYLTDKAAARANLGLGNVDNTSDLDKPVSLATQAALATKADVNHTHTKADITDLSLSWNDVTGKPSTFPPSTHTHTKADIADLSLSWNDVTGKPSTFPPSTHTHTKADIADLSVSWNDVTGKPSTFPPSPHTHTFSQITAGTVYDSIVIGSKTSHWTWHDGLQIRERGGLANAVSEWEDAPRITFHWGNRVVKNIGVRSDGLMAVDNDPIALHSDLAGKASANGNNWSELVWTGDSAGPLDLFANWGLGIFYVEFGLQHYKAYATIISTINDITLNYTFPPGGDGQLKFNDGYHTYALKAAVTFTARKITAQNNAYYRIKNIWRLARSNS